MYLRHDFLVIVAFYAYDALIMARNVNDVQNVIQQLKQTFEFHELKLEAFVGFQIQRPSADRIVLHQTSYVNKIVRNFGHFDLEPERSPIVNLKGESDPKPLDESLPYREIVGSLLLHV